MNSSPSDRWRIPDAVAVVAGEQSLTFAALDRRANQLAHILLDLGVGPEAVVGVCTSSSCELVVALLAVLRAGAAYLPIEAEQPRERLFALLADAGVQVIIVDDLTRDCEWPREPRSSQTARGARGGRRPRQ